jgi:hypothetical protein
MAKMQIKRVGVLSYAKISCVVMTGIALVVAIPLGLIMMVIGAAALTQDGAAGGVGIGMGLAYMVILPIMYGVMGFIFGAIGALIYNVAAGFVGGIELELENTEAGYAAPPPPQWSADQQYQPGQQQYPYS